MVSVLIRSRTLYTSLWNISEYADMLISQSIQHLKHENIELAALEFEILTISCFVLNSTIF